MKIANYAILATFISVGALADTAPYLYGGRCPASAGDGSTAGVLIGPNTTRYWAQDGQLGGYEYFAKHDAFFPNLITSINSLAPGKNTVDMAYAVNGTMAWYNVTVPAAGTYQLKFRYAFAYGLFPGVSDRAEGIKVNGIVADSNMHFLVTGSFDTFCHSAINVVLNTGTNTIQMYNLSEHGVSRVDDLTVAPTTGALTPVSGMPAPSAAAECNNLP